MSDSETAVQLGKKLEISLPLDHIPVDILWSYHIGISAACGTVTSPIRLFSEFYSGGPPATSYRLQESGAMIQVAGRSRFRMIAG
jgi:hypothetical protein